jgi:hypothetical protein
MQPAGNRNVILLKTYGIVNLQGAEMPRQHRAAKQTILLPIIGAALMLLLLFTPSILCGAGFNTQDAKTNLWPYARAGAGLSVQAAWLGSIPSEFMEDPLPIRTHLYFGYSLDIVHLQLTPRWSVAARISHMAVSSSIAYGTSIWRPYTLTGAGVLCTARLNEAVSLGAGLDLLVATYGTTGGTSGVVSWSIIPTIALSDPSKSRHCLNLSFPLKLFVHPDHTAVSAGIGCSWKVQASGMPGGSR